MDEPRLRILLVDDDEDDYLITREVLAEVHGARCQLDWQPSYEAARESIARGEHDVYLFDFRLGEHTGLQLLKESVESGCRAPMILLTGQGDHELDMKAMKAGAADYLVKSELNPALLERTIRYAVEKNRILRELEEARARERERFEELDQLKSDLVAFVSHELRVPLTSIRGYVETLQVLEPAELVDRAEEFLGHIMTESDRLLRMINAFLDISAFEAGRSVELVADEIEIRAMVEQAVTIAQANAKRCSFRTQYDETPSTVRGDRDKLLQVLINFLSNADKYSPNGGEVTVAVAAEAEGVRFAVTDHGLGIAPETRGDLFTPFYRIRGAEQRKIRGAGLGLHLCKLLIEAHEGRLGVDSELGKGSTFWFVIPRREG